MAYTTINKSTAHFNTKLYTGTGSSNAQTGIGHQPDLVWIKSRSAGWDHEWYDAVRGVGKSISSVTANAEGNSPQGVTAFGSDGFTVGTRSGVNENNSTYVSWNWKANGQGSANTDGSINTTYTSVNTTAGFSISKFTGTGSAATVGHGLGAVPKMYLVKNLSTSSTQWRVYHASLGATKHMALDATQAAGTASSVFNNTEPTSSVFSVGTDDAANKSGDNLIAYCFAEKTGYSKFGSYVGLGGTNYPFIYTGFKPAFVMAKRTNDTSNWVMYDNKRQYNNIEGQYNPQRPRLASNLSAAESSFTSDNGVDLLSNGFVVRDNSNDAYTINISGSTYIYMAFAEAPLVGTNNVPCNAR